MVPKGRQVLRETLRVFGSTPRVVALVWRASPGRVATLAVLTALQGLLPAATVWVGKLVVDGVVATVSAGGDPATLRTLVGLVGLQFGLGVAGIALGHIVGFVQQALGDLVGHRLSVRILAHANTLDLAHFETPEYYDRLRNAQRLGSQPVQLVTGGLLQLGRNTITIVSMAGFLWRFHPLLPVALLLASLPQVVAQMYYGRFGWRLMHRQAPLYRKQSYLGSVITESAHAKEVRLFGLGDHLLDRYVTAALETLRQNWDYRTRQRRTSTLLSLLSSAASSGAYLYTVLQAAAGRITLGDLTLYAGAVSQVQGTLWSILSGVTSVYQTNLQVEDLFRFLDYRPRVVSGRRRLPVPVPLRQGVEFRDAVFSYPPAVLRGVSFLLPAGQTVALVGANGAGKTTLVKLLCRLYDPTEGQVLLDGVDLREYHLDDLRRQIAVAFQDYARYHLAARDNIGFGQVEHLGDTARVSLAATQGGAASVVERLPQGLETTLGRIFSGGVELSGGEWQKVALARAFMRQAPQLLILDEPTAALDAQAEYEVYTRFRELTRGRTALLISHRFSTVRMADRIVVLEEGRVTEQGSHAELVAAGGTYARLYEMQAERYR